MHVLCSNPRPPTTLSVVFESVDSLSHAGAVRVAWPSSRVRPFIDAYHVLAAPGSIAKGHTPVTMSSHPLKMVTCTCPSRGQSSEAIIYGVTQIAFFVNRSGKGGSNHRERNDWLF